MARLTIEQIKAPDLSVASQATARAGESFREGMSSASDLLSKYQGGLEAQGDAQLTNLLAGAKNEEEWNSILANTDFSQMNISAQMRDNIMNRRDNILGYENQRADTRLVDANTGSVNATAARTRNQIGLDNNADARLQGNYNYENTRRNELGALVAPVLASERDGRTNGFQNPGEGPVSGQSYGAAALTDMLVTPGTNAGPRADGSGLSVANPRAPIQANNDDVLMLARTLQAEAGNQGREGMMDVGAVIANRVGDSRYGDGTIRGVVMRDGQFSAWNGVTGYAGGEQGQNMDFEPNADALAAAQAIISGNYEDRTNGATHYVNKNISNPSWGENVTYQRGDHWFGQADGPGNGQRPTPPPPQRVTQNPNQGGPARDALYSALSGTTALDPATALAITQGDYNYAQTGQDAITAENERIGREIRDRALVDGINDPNNFRPGDLISDVFNNPNLTASERLAAIEAARQTEETAGTLFSPTVTSNPVLDAVTQAQIDTNTRNFNNSPANQFIVDADKYNADPVAFLQEKLDLSNDSQALPEETVNNISRYIDDIIADNPNVSRGEVVAAMERSFVKDPGDDDNSSFWHNSDMTLNTIERRFPEREIKELLDQFAGPEARNRYDSLQIANLSTRTGIEDTTYQRTQLLTQAQKYPVGSPERVQLEQEAKRLEGMLFSGNSDATITRKLREYIEETPNISQRLSGLDPNSMEYDKVLADVEAGIQSDRSLSSTDKRLMIAALRG